MRIAMVRYTRGMHAPLNGITELNGYLVSKSTLVHRHWPLVAIKLSSCILFFFYKVGERIL